MRLFFGGDVMTGRGVDQALPHPGDPALHEPCVRDARVYLRLAEAKNGPVARPAGFAYPWGAALAELERQRPDARIVNLETAVTAGGVPAPKGINYRMHPGNIGCLTAARLDCCAVANNHALDWGEEGLLDTLAALDAAGLGHAGAGRDRAQASAPAVIEVPGQGRVLVFAAAASTSGVPAAWGATESRAGVCLLDDPPERTARRIAEAARASRRPGDVVVASLHWGGNWGYGIPEEDVRLARALVDSAGVDIVHGHSSHHPKAIEVYHGRPILYGCGDLLDDYEGIAGCEEFRDDLGLMYFVTLDPGSRALAACEMVPTRRRRLRLERAEAPEARWLAGVLSEQGRRFATAVRERADGLLELRWG